MSRLRATRMLWTVLNETVVSHEDLVQDLYRLESMMGVTYLMHNAIESGSVSNRPRLFGLEGASVENMPLSTHAQPAFVLKPNWNFKKIPVRRRRGIRTSTRLDPSGSHRQVRRLRS